MFKIPTLSKLPSYKVFDYTPRYYDPVKEEIKDKLKKKQGFNANNTDKNEIEIRIKGSFRQNTRRTTNAYTGITRGLIVVLFIISLFSMLYIGYYALLILFSGIIGLYFLTKRNLQKTYKNE